MKKSTLLIALFTCFFFAANAQQVPLDPAMLIPLQFTNGMPVIQEAGLRIDLTGGTEKNYTVTMEQTAQDVLGNGMLTTVWGYRFPGKPATYPGATIVAKEGVPLEIKWKNKLPGHFLPVDVSLHMAHPAKLKNLAEIRDWYAAGNVPTVAHLHGGHTESASDGLPEAWYTQNDEFGAYYVKQKYNYANDQEAATLWYHDHALGITRLNVYAGLAGFYLLRDNNELGLIGTETVANVLPSEAYEIEIVIQDRMFDMQGQLFWPAYPNEGPYNEFIYDLDTPAVLPPGDFPGGGPSVLAEFFGDVILVNGMAWPKLDVEPRKYRFRLLNGSDSRFYILKLDDNSNMIVIGSDDGLLSQQEIVNELIIAPGERYDVVIDFSGNLMGDEITMLNLGPDEPYGGGVPGVDFDPANPATTGKIMQFQVNTSLSGVPDATIDEITSVNLNTIAPLTADNPTSPRQLALFEGLDEYGRLQPMLGTLADGSLTWSQDITENPNLGATEIWEVYNATADAHPIHLHLVKFQVLGRQDFTYTLTQRPQLQHNGTFGTGGMLTNVTKVGSEAGSVEPYETGWKDTFIVPPGQVGRVIAKFDLPGRYVWHCHILSHEDHEMMRPLHVGPIPPPKKGGGKKGAYVGDQQVEPDQFGEFRLYPNPASGLITVDLVLAEGAEIDISIYGLDGRMINSEKLGYLNDGFQSILVPVDHLDNGMYILELKAGNKQFRENIIVNK